MKALNPESVRSETAPEGNNHRIYTCTPNHNAVPETYDAILRYAAERRWPALHKIWNAAAFQQQQQQLYNNTTGDIDNTSLSLHPLALFPALQPPYCYPLSMSMSTSTTFGPLTSFPMLIPESQHEH
ncbi:hypothetical protein VTN00DRAFT_8196 [Thermoascus crustaceus]|uniref:uncharacterized protein n=1 Tax=Thermoascus crustaceus TaxID=5088 RepID=UPI00374210CA